MIKARINRDKQDSDKLLIFLHNHNPFENKEVFTILPQSGESTNPSTQKKLGIPLSRK